MIVNTFFEANPELYPNNASRKQHATEILASLDFLYKDPKASVGLFRSDLIVSTLSSYYSQVQGALDVCDVRHAVYYSDEGPLGAIALAITAVSFTIVVVTLY